MSCPVDHKALSEGGCPVMHKNHPMLMATLPSASTKPTTPSVVEGCDSLDAAAVNDKFADAKPFMFPDQREKLSTRAIPSNIPKTGNSEETWTYPSPQRFYNAMRKKGWDPKETDMENVVTVHNAVNEQAWKKMLEWESLHKCATPKLKSFKGLPRDYSPKARLLNIVGYSLPFDRHDWTIDRCGEDVRYIIDFYSGSQVAGSQGLVPSIYLDVRPALTVQGVVDRLRMQARNITNAWTK